MIVYGICAVLWEENISYEVCRRWRDLSKIECKECKSRKRQKRDEKKDNKV